MTVLHARADLYSKQVFYCTNTPNRFSTVQYRCIFVLLFGQHSLQLDNKVHYFEHNKPVRSFVMRNVYLGITGDIGGMF